MWLPGEAGREKYSGFGEDEVIIQGLDGSMLSHMERQATSICFHVGPFCLRNSGPCQKTRHVLISRRRLSQHFGARYPATDFT